MPYLILQIGLVLCYYVICSEKYEEFRKRYTDIEHDEKREHLRRLAMRNRQKAGHDAPAAE